jgi:hypothetical protein
VLRRRSESGSGSTGSIGACLAGGGGGGMRSVSELGNGIDDESGSKGDANGEGWRMGGSMLNV